MTDLAAIRPVLRELLTWCDALGPVIHLLSVEDLALLRAIENNLDALRRLAAAPEQPAAEHSMAEVRHVLHEAVNSVCRCGGAGPGEGCAACDLWHALPRWMREDEVHG